MSPSAIGSTPSRDFLFVFKSKLTHRFCIEHLKAESESVCRGVPGGCDSKATSMLWNTEHLECDYMLFPQMTVPASADLVLNFISTDSETKIIKASWENHRVWLGGNDACFMINCRNKREQAQFEFFIMPLWRLAKCLCSNWVAESLAYREKHSSNRMFIRHLRVSFWRTYWRKENRFNSSHEI